MTDAFNVSWDNRLFARLGTVNDGVRRAIRQGFFEFGKDLRDTASQEILRRPKGGRTYIVRQGKRRFRHTASAPGETHANLSGKLRRSIGFQIHGSRSMDFGYGVDPRGPAPDYAIYVEDGTSRMAARPSLQNAIRVTLRNGEVYFATGIRAELANESR